MNFEDNKQLANEYKKLLLDLSTSQVQVADALDITKQQIQHILQKQNLSFNDMKRLLSPLGYDLEINFTKKD